MLSTGRPRHARYRKCRRAEEPGWAIWKRWPICPKTGGRPAILAAMSRWRTRVHRELRLVDLSPDGRPPGAGGSGHVLDSGRPRPESIQSSPRIPPGLALLPASRSAKPCLPRRNPSASGNGAPAGVQQHLARPAAGSMERRSTNCSIAPASPACSSCCKPRRKRSLPSRSPSGTTTSAHFYRVFDRLTGETPHSWRRRDRIPSRARERFLIERPKTSDKPAVFRYPSGLMRILGFAFLLLALATGLVRRGPDRHAGDHSDHRESRNPPLSACCRSLPWQGKPAPRW